MKLMIPAICKNLSAEMPETTFEGFALYEDYRCKYSINYDFVFKNVKLDFKKNIIEENFKEAGKYNSEKYIKLKYIRSQFPTFSIVTKNVRKKKSTFKGLDYDYIETYIKKHDNENQSIMKEFNTMRGYVDGKKNEFVDCATYGEIKAWFLLKFPDIEEYNKEVEKLREATRIANEAKKGFLIK